ncbi:rabconnectin-3a, partial [Lecanoromycetidae sp. Uapishka_2]
MRTVLPGKPQAKLQALCTAQWEGLRLVALQLWAEIDLQESIQPRDIRDSYLPERYAFIIDSKDFAGATEQAVQAATSDAQENHALEHLVEITKTSPDICVVVDRRGNMSAWGLENIGCKARKDTDTFNVAHVENLDLTFMRHPELGEENVHFLNFCNGKSQSPFTLLVHHFDGRILWFESKLNELFDPSPRQHRLEAKALWTGHDGSIKKIVRSSSGKALISRTNDNEGLVWKQKGGRTGMALARSSSLTCPEHIHRTCLLAEGDMVVLLHHHTTVDTVNHTVNWLTTSTIETNIDAPSLASGSSIRKVAVVDRVKTALTIWDSWSGQLEHEARYEASDTIQDLDWSSTPDDQSILAVGFPYKVVILAQKRYDYLDAGPAWAPIREIRIKELTSHPIGDSTWLGSGNLVIGAGTQLYVYDNDVATTNDMIVDLSMPDTSYAAKKEMRSSYAEFVDDTDPETVTEELASTLNENLTKLAVPQLSSHEQFHLADIIQCVATAEKQRRSMDENAMRYLLFFRQHIIRKRQAPAGVGVTWREMVWAYHSGSQDILVDLVSRQFHGRMRWEHARESGMFMWMTDITALRTQFEVIARNEYTKTDEKNPIDCSLYYLALKKKTVLLGLWRMAAWNREQAGTQKLLRNDFSEARWKTAALKNAYALLGKRRFEYAAAFFLLAGNLQDAVNVCAHQLQDLQLAIAIARVYDGDESPVLHQLLEDKILPQAALEGNRWLATWAFWMLGRRDMAVRVLISPVHTLVETPQTPSLQAKSYLSTDPALIVLYKQLRAKTLQTLKGASKISPKAEWDFVIQNARLYDRMGCDLLALDLVRNWEFLKQSKDTAVDGDRQPPPDPRKMLRRRSSLVVDDMPSPKSPTERKTKPAEKPAPTVFEEPSSNSLLDSFGF